jgi:hypothetical protein
MRGMALVNAGPLIAELSNLSGFADPCQLMAYLGLVPSRTLERYQRQTAAASPRPATTAPDGF